MFTGRQLQCQHVSELDMTMSLVLWFPEENRVQKAVLSSRICAAGKWDIIPSDFCNIEVKHFLQTSRVILAIFNFLTRRKLYNIWERM